MAELVDALASGASARKGVEVQVLLSAPKDRTTETEVFLIWSTFCLALSLIYTTPRIIKSSA